VGVVCLGRMGLVYQEKREDANSVVIWREDGKRYVGSGK